MKKLLKITAYTLLIVLLLLIGGGLFGYYKLTNRSQGQYFHSGNAELFYFEKGQADGPPVILLHGFASQGDIAFNMTGITDHLADKYRVICMDNRGAGISDKPHDPEAYGMNMVHDVANLMAHLDIDSAHIAGYSLGGFITLKFAATYPERCITAIPMGAGWEDPDGLTTFDALDSLATQLREGNSIGPVIAVFDSSRKEPGTLHKAWMKIMTGYLNDPKALAAILESSTELSLNEEELTAIKVPMCSIVGSEDAFAGSARKLKQKLPHVQFHVIEGSNHITTVRHEALKKHLRTYLDAHTP